MPGRRRRGGSEDSSDGVALGVLVVAVLVIVLFVRWITENPWVFLVAIAIGLLAAAYFAWDWHRERERGRALDRQMRLQEHDRSMMLGRIMQLSPTEFEGFCARLLEATRGMTAQVTRRTNDGGVDIELRDRDGSIGVAQCKQWVHHRVDRPIVQKLYGEMSHRGAAFGILLTTSTFTDGARRWAQDKEIELLDLDEIQLLAIEAR